MSTQSTYQKDYEDARIIGAYLMQTLIDDGKARAKESTQLMASYSIIVSRACGVNQKQVALDIADTFRKHFMQGAPFHG